MKINYFKLFIVLFCIFSSAVKSVENLGVKSLEEAFAVSSVMSDSDALTFGIADFELNYIVDPENPNWGDEESLDFKKSIDVLVIPLGWALPNIERDWSQSINMRVFYLEVARDTEPLQGYTNFEKEQAFGGFVQYSQQYQLSENWYGGLSLGGHLMFYRNKYNYGQGFPTELIELLDGHVFNTTATVLMAEPVLKFGYQKKQSWGQWTLHNSNNYLYGQGIGGSAKNISDVTPEGWRITNGVELKFKVPTIWGVTDHIAVDFKRIDLGGDMRTLADNGNYYETSFGWVIDTQNKIPFLDNIGIGFNINYGSSISGGTVVLYYNE